MPTPKSKPRVPVALGPTRVVFLFKLWQAGYERGVYAQAPEYRAGLELVRYGYAERAPSCFNHFRITTDGRDRLEAPMRLYVQARSHLQVVK